MGTIDLKKVTKEDLLARQPLPEFFVWWNEITNADVASFEATLDSANGEGEMQNYLEQNPLLLIQYLGGGHGRWVVPHKRLGAEHVTDFIIGERDSMGFHWTAVELESPKDKVFNKNGDFSAKTNHAIRQISDWRSWLKKNQNYASRPRSEQGLGLKDIDPDLPGLIIISREKDVDPSTQERRRQQSNQLNIRIHTYDWLLRNARGRVSALETLRSRHPESTS